MADSIYASKVMHTVSRVSSDGPKPPLNFSHHFSRVTKARKESSIKEFYKDFLIPGIVNLAGGKLGPPLFSQIAFVLPIYILAVADHFCRSAQCIILPL